MEWLYIVVFGARITTVPTFIFRNL